jgi:hypothetical protein
MACLSEVGEGAFGTIFHVCDLNGDVEVAVVNRLTDIDAKCLKPSTL